MAEFSSSMDKILLETTRPTTTPQGLVNSYSIPTLALIVAVAILALIIVGLLYLLYRERRKNADRMREHIYASASFGRAIGLSGPGAEVEETKIGHLGANGLNSSVAVVSELITLQSEGGVPYGDKRISTFGTLPLETGGPRDRYVSDDKRRTTFLENIHDDGDDMARSVGSSEERRISDTYQVIPAETGTDETMIEPAPGLDDIAEAEYLEEAARQMASTDHSIAPGGMEDAEQDNRRMSAGNYQIIPAESNASEDTTDSRYLPAPTAEYMDMSESFRRQKLLEEMREGESGLQTTEADYQIMRDYKRLVSIASLSDTEETNDKSRKISEATRTNTYMIYQDSVESIGLDESDTKGGEEARREWEAGMDRIAEQQGDFKNIVDDDMSIRRTSNHETLAEDRGVNRKEGLPEGWYSYARKSKSRESLDRFDVTEEKTTRYNKKPQTRESNFEPRSSDVDTPDSSPIYASVKRSKSNIDLSHRMPTFRKRGGRGAGAVQRSESGRDDWNRSTSSLSGPQRPSYPPPAPPAVIRKEFQDFSDLYAKIDPNRRTRKNKSASKINHILGN